MNSKFYFIICLLVLSLTIAATPGKKRNKKTFKKPKKLVTLTFKHKTLAQCLEMVAKKGGVSYVLTGDIGGEPVTAVFKNVPANNAVKALLIATECEFDYIDGVFVIAGRDHKRISKKLKMEVEILERTLELLEMEQKRRHLERILEKQEKVQQKKAQEKKPQEKKPQEKKVAPKQPAKKTSTIVHYDFTVNIVSGSLYKKVFKGFFSYDSSQLKNKGKESIKAKSMQFVYNGNTYKGFDSVPMLSFVDGKFKDLFVVGGKSNQRFGFNSGFNRWQFGRSSEKFIRDGKPYFGYLSKHRYVDGAGTINYTKR